QVKQHTGALGTEPGPAVQPADQSEVLRLLGEVSIPVALADELGVRRLGGWSASVASQAAWVFDAELRRQEARHHGGHRGRIWQEGAEEPHRAELNSQAKADVFIAPLKHERAVTVIKVEIASELGWRGFTQVPSVLLLLVGGEKVHGHGLSPMTRFHR